MKSSAHSRSSLPLLRLASSTAIALALAGCSAETTQLVVVVRSDYGPDLAEVAVEISHDAGSLGTQRFETERFPLPISFGVLPPGDDARRAITVVARAFHHGGGELSFRRAATGFIENKILLLPLFLARSCQTRTCPDEQTCTETGCRSPNVDPSTLTEVEPGREGDYPFPVDRDGGIDDGGVVGDGGPVKDRDAGPPDAMPPPRVGSGAVQTAGGASLISPTHRMTVYVGTPQPLREQSSAQHRIRLEVE